jgi:replicative DNA helicase
MSTKRGSAEAMASEGLVMPESVQTERFVLSACLTFGDAAVASCLTEQLAPEHFFDQRNRVLYTVLIDLERDGESIDLATVGHRLVRDGEVNQVGGLALLSELSGLAVQVDLKTSIKSWAKIIREKADLRTVIKIAQQTITAAMVGDAPKTVVTSLSNRLHNSFRSILRSEPRSMAEIADQMGSVQHRLDPTYGVTAARLFTGFRALDEVTGGYHEKETWVWGARPGMGKTSIMMQIAMFLGALGIPNIVFSLEMAASVLYQRMLCQRAEIPFVIYQQGEDSLHEKQRARLMEADAYISSLPIWIDDTKNLTASDVWIRTARAQEEHGIQQAAVDYLGKLAGRDESMTKEYDQLTYNIGQLNYMAGDLGISLNVFSQLSRFYKRGNPEPTMEDLRGTGAIEQDAQNVILVHRPEVYRPKDTALRGKGILDLAKQRNGETKRIEMRWIGWRFMYQDIDLSQALIK